MTASELLGLDLGTSGVRALRVDASGAVHARSHRRLATRTPGPGLVEQDPAELFDASLRVLREALAGADPARVAAIGIATQRATALAWDARTGEPLAPALGWQDRRTLARASELRASGLRIGAQPSATRYEWMLRECDRVRAAASAGRLCLGTPDAWLTHRLCEGSAHVTDPGQASCTGLYDLVRGDWSAPVLRLFGIEVGWLPRIVATSEVVGRCSPRWFGQAIPIAARAGDQQAACFAQGLLTPGDAKLTLGTSAMLDVRADSPRGCRAPGAHALALWRLPARGDAFCREGSLITAGAVVDWLVAVGLLPDAASFDRVAGSVESSDGVVFVPALAGLGTPWADDGVHGSIVGLTRGTRAAHLARAALDGIAQRCADLCETLAPAALPLRVDGGLARSRLLLQRIADLAGRPLLVAGELETTALGAAAFAGLAVGLLERPEQAAALPGPPVRVEPALAESPRRSLREVWRAQVERTRGGA